MMKWILLILMFTSCLNRDGKSEFETSVLKNIPFAVSVEGVFPNTNKDTEIKSPPNTWIRIFQALVMDESGSKTYHCLYYRVPGKENGILRHINSKESCNENYQDGEIRDWTGISGLKVWKPNFERKIFEKVLKPGRFYLTGKGEREDFFFEIPLFNLKVERKLERHSTAFSSNMLSGLFVSKKRDLKSKVNHEKFLGKFEDNYRDGTAIVCQEFSKDCKETTPFNCNNCRFGWYSAVGISTCGGQYTRFCGVNKCGQRGMPACPRGLDSAKRMELDNVMLCYDGSPLGYCETGLKTVCDGKILVCL